MSVLLAAEAHVHVADGAASLGWLIPLLPLAGFILLLAGGRRLGSRAGWVATGLVAASFALSLAVAVQVAGLDTTQRSLLVPLYDWLDVGALHVRTDLLIDPLTVVMLLVVTGVSSLVHLYSIGYMHGDEREPRYFAYLNLFVFSMLVLVLAGDFVVLFVGWELVGLCSYLLIGFWFEERANAVAAKKAMIVNRVGDVSFAIGLFLMFAHFGSLAFPDVLPAAASVLGDQPRIATAIALLLFGGAVGKSAQIPLYVWLPDAMAGPTPVSALIHAATMVTAGVYMIARSSSIYIESDVAMTVVAVVGAATALLAALIAVQQDDIKKVLAYSTVSQLGYMVMAVGVGAFTTAIFHLVTHAFFKGLLFLAAGSVMHALANRTDIWGMGGLRKLMPITFWTTLVGWLAICGVFPFAGFWSKDQILAAAYDRGATGVWIVGLVTAAITAFYMSRWFFVAFAGARRWGKREDLHPHESPATMTIPLVLLAAASLVGGAVLNITHGGRLDRFLETAVAHPEAPEAGLGLEATTLIALALLASAVGIGLAYLTYLRRRPERDPLPARLGVVATAMRRRFWVDEAYDAVFVRAGGAWATFLVWFDATVIDGVVEGVARGANAMSSRVRVLQTGLVRTYVAFVVVGTIAVVVAFLAGSLGGAR